LVGVVAAWGAPLVGVWALGYHAPRGAAQPSPFTSDPRQAATYRPVDQGVADQNPLSVGARVVPIDLRSPMGFERLFRLTGPGDRLETRGDVAAPDGGRGLFFRFSGGLVASFPRSVYADAPGGLLPLIPPGTTFSIGERPAWGPTPAASYTTAHARGSPPQRRAVLSSSNGAGGTARSGANPSSNPSDARPAASRVPAREIESLWSSEAYRRRLVERWLAPPPTR
jgi:hypothetical protein